MARTYKRDSRGRFAGGGGSSSRGGGRKPMQRGTNRLTRDNAGRITSVGGDGATARGGRLRTASGKQRATVTAKGIGKAPAGTVGRSGKVKAPRQSDATVMGGTSRIPASQRPGSITNTLRGTLRSLAQADARRIREIESITGQPVRAPRRAPAGQGATVRAPGRRSISGTLGDNLRALAQSDARTARGMADLAKPSPAGAIKGGSSRKALKPAAAKPAATAKPASKLGFTQSDFARRSQRTASIRNPQVKAKAQQLYGKILDLNSTPRQLKSMFKKAGKPKQRTATAATRQMRREHQNMMAASKVLFK